MHNHENCDCGEDDHFAKANDLLHKSFEIIKQEYGITVDATLFKAVTEKDFKEFFLKNLFDNNESYFKTWYEKLKKAVQSHLQREQVFPLRDEDIRKLDNLFSLYKDAFELNALGWQVSPKRMLELKDARLIDAGVLHFPDIAFRLGVLGDAIREMKEREGESLTETMRAQLFRNLVREASKIGLTKIDRDAINFSVQRAHGYIRPLLNQMTGDLMKDLHTEETIIHSYVMRGIKREEGTRVLARKLGNEMRSRGYTRDYDRVMRTEIGEAYSLGRWQFEVKDAQAFGTNYNSEVMRQTGASKNDLLVYKVTSLGACKYCRIFWRHDDGTPKLYTEAWLRSREPNYGKKARDWQPQLGLIHPNCRENGIRVARYGVDNLTYPKLFDYEIQDNIPVNFDED